MVHNFPHGYCAEFIGAVVRIQCHINGNVLSQSIIHLITGSTASFLFCACPFSSSPSEFKISKFNVCLREPDDISLISSLFKVLNSMCF